MINFHLQSQKFKTCKHYLKYFLWNFFSKSSTRFLITIYYSTAVLNWGCNQNFSKHSCYCIKITFFLDCFLSELYLHSKSQSHFCSPTVQLQLQNFQSHFPKCSLASCIAMFLVAQIKLHQVLFSIHLPFPSLW